MSDRHMRILRVAARHSEHDLEVHDAAAVTPGAGSTPRRLDLERTAARTRARVAAAQARRLRAAWSPR